MDVVQVVARDHLCPTLHPNARCRTLNSARQMTAVELT